MYYCCCRVADRSQSYRPKTNDIEFFVPSTFVLIKINMTVVPSFERWLVVNICFSHTYSDESHGYCKALLYWLEDFSVLSILSWKNKSTNLNCVWNKFYFLRFFFLKDWLTYLDSWSIAEKKRLVTKIIKKIWE